MPEQAGGCGAAYLHIESSTVAPIAFGLDGVPVHGDGGSLASGVGLIGGIEMGLHVEGLEADSDGYHRPSDLLE